MMNNDILRSIRFTFDLNDHSMIKIFSLSGVEVTRDLICDFLKREDDPDFLQCKNIELISFLDGLIIFKRGKQEGSKPINDQDTDLTNNVILRKLKIAFNLKSEELMDILKLADINVSKHELSALFRNKNHKHFRPCQDQFLRKFLKGLQLTHRPTAAQNEPK